MIEPVRIQREIDKAWTQHNPERGRVPSEISRRVRTFKRELEPSAAAIARTFAGSAWKGLATDALCKRAVGRDRALVKIRRAFAGANVAIGGKTLAINWLMPSDHVLVPSAADPGLIQDCVLAHLALAWLAQRVVTLWSQWILEVPDHALGRVLQRSPQANLADCMAEAAAGFLDADANSIRHAAKHHRPIYLRAGKGVFVAEVISADDGGGEVVLYARARTYLTSTMLGDSQVPVGAAADSNNSVLELLLQIAHTTWTKEDDHEQTRKTCRGSSS